METPWQYHNREVESKSFSMIRRLKLKQSTLIFVSLLLSINIILFREMIFSGKVPIAFDYGVNTYQPWKLDYEESFSTSPKKIGHDDIRIFYPQRKFIIDSIKKGEIPFWNPFEFSGNVSLANSQTSTFYPPFILFFILPQLMAWSWLSFSIPIIAGLGSYLFFKRLVQNKYGAIFASLVFAFSTPLITRTEDGLVAGHSIIWMPWVLYAIEKIFSKEKVSGFIIATIALIFSMLAGWFQFTFYVFALGFLYGLFRWFNNNTQKRAKSDLAVLILIFTFSILLTTFHWLPALEALKFSPRGVLSTPADFSKKHLMPLGHLVTLLIPSFFGHIASDTYYGASEFKEGVITIGAIPFLLAILGIIKNRKNKKVMFFSVAFLVALLLGLKTPFAKAFISLKIPVISSFLPNRIFIIGAFALSVISAFGFQEIVKNRQIFRKILYLALGIFLLMYLTTAGIYIYEKLLAQAIGFSFFEKGIERYMRIAFKESIFPFFLILATLTLAIKVKEKQLKIFLTAIFLFTILSQIYRANRYLYFSQVNHEFPNNPIFEFLKENTKEDASRFISLSYSRITSNIPSYYNLYFPEGVDAMYPIWYAEFADFFEGKEISTDDVLRIETTFSEELERRRWNDPKTINLLSHLGIRYIIVPKEAFHIIPPEPAFKRVFAHKWHTVYEYQYAFPRAYFVEESTYSDDKTLTLQRIFHPLFFQELEVVLSRDEKQIDFTDEINIMTLSNIDLVSKQKQLYAAMKKDPFTFVREAKDYFSINPISLRRYDANKVILEADVNKDGYIVISDSYFPGWTAKVDGEDSIVYRANHAFRAVPVQKGKHTITMSYVPKSFQKGIAVSAVSFVLVSIAILAVVTKIGYKKDK